MLAGLEEHIPAQQAFIAFGLPDSSYVHSINTAVGNTSEFVLLPNDFFIVFTFRDTLYQWLTE